EPRDPPHRLAPILVLRRHAPVGLERALELRHLLVSSPGAEPVLAVREQLRRAHELAAALEQLGRAERFVEALVQVGGAVELARLLVVARGLDLVADLLEGARRAGLVALAQELG